MRLGLALVAVGVLILLDRMGTGYGIREGWPWIVVALGGGGIFSDRKSVAAWVTTIVGVFILGGKYYALRFSLPGMIRIYFLPVLLIVIGLIWLWKYQKD